MRKKTTLLVCLLLALCLLFSAAPTDALAESPYGTDLLLVLTHVGDESLFFSGLLAEYAAEQGYHASVLYVADADDALRAQAADHLARLGVDAAPIFLGFDNVYGETLADAERLWSHAALTEALTAAIRELRPAIVVTHDVQGEYGNGQHRMVSDCVLTAVQSSGLDTFAADSAAAFGTHTVQRLYRHLSKDETAHTVTIDARRPLIALNGATALETDTALFLDYPAHMHLGRLPADTGHMQPFYTLTYAAESAPAPTDNHLFSALDGAALIGPNPAMPTPAPTAEPREAPAKEAAAPSSAVTETVPAEAAGARPLRSAAIAMAALGIGVILFAIGKRKANKRLFSILCGIGAASVLIGAALLLVPAQPAAPAAEAIPAPTATAEPTAAPTEAPTPAPTKAPDPFDAYFRGADDPAEVVVADEAAEHWEYRSDTLSIIIDRIHTENAHSQPIAYCVAHIRMRGEDAFVSGMVDRKREYLWQMARRQRTVFGITGDNLDRAEGHLKGIILRDGVIHNNQRGADTLAFLPNLGLAIYAPDEITAEQLLDMGVRNTASFGPTLVHEDRVAFEAFRINLGAINPRCGIGMVEPGHLIAITVDGRQEEYSRGISLDAFKQLFYMYGCTEAYNLDGGSSTAMVFMGEHLNKHSGVESDVPRKLMDGLLWGTSELVPQVSDPIYSDGVKLRKAN